MTDLEIIGNLLHMMVDHQKGGWQELERRYNITERAMHRLRLARKSGELKVIGLGLSRYFDSTSTEPKEVQGE